jgi:DNA-binding SARP family transcriptional activator
MLSGLSTQQLPINCPGRCESVSTMGELELWLQLVGGFAVYRRDRPQQVTQVGSRKARTLLALLAVERGRLVTVDEVIEAVWEDAPPRRPADNVATLVSRLRATLGPGSVAGGRAGYRLGQTLRVDLYEAGAMVTEAEARLGGDEPTLALVTAGRAMELLGGGAVLADQPNAIWAEPARIHHAELLRRARHAVAEAALRTGDPQAAVATAAAAVAADPFDEAAYRTLMQAHHAAGEPARALDAYQRLRTALTEELGVDPAPATRDLHVAILRDRATAAPSRRRPYRGGRRPAGLVGREPEVARLGAAWSQAAGGDPRLFLIGGEAGIGKTRLAEHAAQLAEQTGGLVARVRCYQIEQSLSLQPVAEALTGLVTSLPAAVLEDAAGDRAGALAALVPEVGTVLGVAPDEWGSAEGHRRRSCDAVAVFLRRLSAVRPVLLLLDDLADADPATVQLVHYLARHLSGGRLLVVATVRTGDGGPVLATLAEVVDRCDLGPLDPTAIARLAAAAGHPHRAAEIDQRTRGHTHSVVETLQALAAGETGVPPSLRTAVLERVRRAGRQAEELLRAAAVLGDPFTPTGIAALLDMSGSEAARRCERLLATGLTIVAGRGYAFGNELIRQVLYDTTPVPTRLAYHHTAAQPAPAAHRDRASRSPTRRHHRPGGAIQRLHGGINNSPQSTWSGRE